jgi:hypothetical protein
MRAHGEVAERMDIGEEDLPEALDDTKLVNKAQTRINFYDCD